MAAHAGILQPGEDRVNADPFVIALARRHGLTVVSEERRSGNPSAPKIPNVCAARGVRCVNLLGLMADLGWTF
jgi:nucleotide-binding universal stress UspA family protein